MIKVLTPLFVHQEGPDASLGKQTHQVVGLNDSLNTVQLRNIHTQLVHSVPNEQGQIRVDTLVTNAQLIQRPDHPAWAKSHEDAVVELMDVLITNDRA